MTDTADKREHYHCPNGCEKPQEVRLADGRLICQHCFYRYDQITEMILCTPETCKV